MNMKRDPDTLASVAEWRMLEDKPPALKEAIRKHADQWSKDREKIKDLFFAVNNLLDRDLIDTSNDHIEELYEVMEAIDNEHSLLKERDKMMKVEMAVLWGSEDGTWTLEVVEIEGDRDTPYHILDERGRNAIYNIPAFDECSGCYLFNEDYELLN